MTDKNLWDVTRGVLRRKFIALHTYIRKKKRPPSIEDPKLFVTM